METTVNLLPVWGTIFGCILCAISIVGLLVLDNPRYTDRIKNDEILCGLGRGVVWSFVISLILWLAASVWFAVVLIQQ